VIDRVREIVEADRQAPVGVIVSGRQGIEDGH
jgi:hypothetical protein